MYKNKKQSLSTSGLLLCITTLLLLIGLIFVYSSSAVFALECYGNTLYFVKKQAIGILCGLLAIIVLQCVPYQFIQIYSPLFFIVSMGLTLLTLIGPFAHRVNGSGRWIKLGITFQPSELLIIATILMLALLLEHTAHLRRNFLYGYLPVLILVLMPSLVLLKQPDFGLSIAIILTSFIMLFCAQGEIKHLVSTIAIFIPLSIGLVLLKPYRFKRVMTFLNPWQDPQGAGFQIIQSLIAIGSGGLCGAGFGHSKQKFFYLPMQHTDFIFAIIAEEIGFVGLVIIIALYLSFIYMGFRIAQSIPSLFGRYAVIGFNAFIGLQTFMNIAVASGRIPTKGVGLPFISYGNTSLVCHLIMVGLIINFARKTVPILLYSCHTV